MEFRAPKFLKALFRGIADRRYYKCVNCGYQYSIHLAKKCPKCSEIFVDEHCVIKVKVPTTIEKFNIKINKKELQ